MAEAAKDMVTGVTSGRATPAAPVPRVVATVMRLLPARQEAAPVPGSPPPPGAASEGSQAAPHRMAADELHEPILGSS